MPEEKRQIFRERSLKKISSPDRLDHLLKVIRPRNWIAVGATGIGIALALAWSLLGRIPITANGSAILVRPKQVVSFQSAASGSIQSIAISAGDYVKQGDVLALLRLPTLEKQLEQERSKLEHFRSRTEELSELERELAEREREHLGGQRALIEERIETVVAAAERYKERVARYIEEQRENLATTKVLATELGVTLEARHESYQRLKEQRIATENQIIEVWSDVVANRRHLADLEVKRKELDLTDSQAQESYDEQMDLVKDLRMQLNDIEIREMAIGRRLREDELGAKSGAEEIERKIGELTVQLESEGQVTSEYTGRILEITAAVGQHVAIGQRLGKMEIEDPDAGLKALAYLRVKDGKKVAPELKIRISPATAERERFGAIVGRVVTVSDYPVTVDAAANQIGDRELARSLLAGESRIEVLAELEVDEASFTGYRWTSGRGPDDLPITAGTTAEVRVTIEERAPITLVLPFLEEMLR